MSADLLLERQGPVLIARLNRPDARNALTQQMLIDISAAIVEAENDPDIRVLLLTAAGDRAFCSGMDLRSFSSGEQMGTGNDTDAYHRLIRGEVAVPMVGAANGTAVAGGFELLLGCDVIVASSEAQFGFPEVKRGLIPGGGGTFVGARIALNVALELTLTGETIGAARAYELGLVNAVVPPEDVFATALALAEKIAANAPLALIAVKELTRLAATDAAAAWSRLDHWRQAVFHSEDAKEGAMAYVEKRAPVWSGR
jgi:enoyl-CoA hydratase/carnithine racemase